MAEKIAYDLRGKYLKALLKQEIAFFEKNNVESMPSDIGQYFQTISLGIGEAYGQLCQAVGTLIGGVAIGFSKGPVFALVCLAYMPILLIIVMVFGKISKTAAIKKLGANKDLGGTTEEALSALKLIVSFAQEDMTINKFKKQAAVTREVSSDANAKASVVFGTVRFMIFGFFLYSYYIATVFVQKQVLNPQTQTPYTVSEIVAVSQAMIMSMMQILGILPNVTAVAKAGVMGKKVFDIIERQPLIQDGVGKQNRDEKIVLTDKITFNKVRFRYPTAPETQPDTLQGVSFEIKSGTSTAIVGPSGSGKSTIVQLLERFYDATSGEIRLDGEPLTEFSLSQLRSSIGYVS